MNSRREFIADALTQRYREVCGEGLTNVAAANFGEHAAFVSEVIDSFGKAGASVSVTHLGPFDSWLEADIDCFTALRRLALGERLAVRSASQPPTVDFVRQLKEVRAQPAQRFQLLTERYVCPLNFAIAGEELVCEHLLERLMVQDRARIEQHSIKAVDSNDILFRLNLIAIKAARVPDLRFIDALNYYYELIPPNWRATGQDNWLQVSYLALYAQALVSMSGKQ
jgi:hypothetical protein